MKVSIQEEDTTIKNIYALNTRSPWSIQQTPSHQKRRDRLQHPTLFNTQINQTENQWGHTGIEAYYRANGTKWHIPDFHPMATENTFLTAHGNIFF